MLRYWKGRQNGIPQAAMQRKVWTSRCPEKRLHPKPRALLEIIWDLWRPRCSVVYGLLLGQQLVRGVSGVEGVIQR